MPLQIVGTISNYVTQPSPTPEEQAHDEGLTFVAMDSRSFPYWKGGMQGDSWIVRRVLRARLDQLRPWPEIGFKFRDLGQAQQAYLTLRQHFLSRLPGAQSRPELIEGETLMAGQQAWAEAIYWNGQLVAWIACDRPSDALALTWVTRGLEQFQPDGGPTARCASYATQVSHAYVAAAAGPGGTYDHALIVFSPGDETDLIEQGLVGAENDGTAEPFAIDVPSGVLILAWGRVPGAWLFGNAQGDPAAVIAGAMGPQLQQAASTPLDQRAETPYVWGLRMTPGTYDVDYWFVDTDGGGISCMVLSRQGAAPFRPAAPPPAQAPAGFAGTLQLADGRVFNVPMPVAPQGPIYPANDPDPVVFPGQRIGRLSEYVGLMKAMQSGDFQGALARFGLDMMAYSEVAARWGQAFAADPGLNQKMMQMMMQ